MPEFSRISKDRLDQAHLDLQRLFNRVIYDVDCSILCSVRGEAVQNALYAQGKSKLEYPHSRHNMTPSLAVDVAPYPIPENWQRTNFDHFAGIVRGVAIMMGIKIRWGGDWDGDYDLKDQTFDDLVHFELIVE